MNVSPSMEIVDNRVIWRELFGTKDLIKYMAYVTFQWSILLSTIEKLFHGVCFTKKRNIIFIYLLGINTFSSQMKPNS